MSGAMSSRSGAPAFVLSLLRFVAGLSFMQHGLSKLFGFPAAAPAHMTSLVVAAAIIEVLGGLLVCVGLFARLAAFIMSGEMAIAYFTVHFPKSFFPILNGGDLAIMYCFVFFYIAVAGGGAWSLDRLIAGPRSRLAGAAAV